MTDDDKTPVGKPAITPEFELACKQALDAVGALPQVCGAPIRDRSGRDLGYVCNLGKGHLGKHASIWRHETLPRHASILVDDAK